MALKSFDWIDRVWLGLLLRDAHFRFRFCIGISAALDGAVVGWVAIAGYNKLTQWLFQHRALGQGDEILALGLGAWLGPEVFMSVLFKSLLLSLWFLILVRGITSKWPKVIPFAPMLALPSVVTVLHMGSLHLTAQSF